ncbi:unnamed protein product [Ilex paraguariensis]|uniref:Uncharacterized protein n=1 Tax=Ilex paraguariensis TaxID=185542 RepID=A0ABC8TW35_9AQUA
MVWLITDCAGLVYFSSWLCFNRIYFDWKRLDSCTHELICTPKLLKSGTGLKASLMSYLTKGIPEVKAECAGHSTEGVEKLPLPSTTSSPLPSISSRGLSWIDEFFDPEVSSSAPAQGQRQQEEGGLFQPPQPAPSSSSTGVGPHEPPTSEEVKSKLADFLSSFGRRKARANFIDRTERELEISAASPEKLGKLIQIMETLSRGPNKPNSGQNAAAKLTMELEAWAKRVASKPSTKKAI